MIPRQPPKRAIMPSPRTSEMLLCISFSIISTRSLAPGTEGDVSACRVWAERLWVGFQITIIIT